jgi:hypothetical protein
MNCRPVGGDGAGNFIPQRAVSDALGRARTVGSREYVHEDHKDRKASELADRMACHGNRDDRSRLHQQRPRRTQGGTNEGQRGSTAGEADQAAVLRGAEISEVSGVTPADSGDVDMPGRPHGGFGLMEPKLHHYMQTAQAVG